MASGILENDFMFSGRDVVPWHGIGVVVEGELSSEDAIKTAKLGWSVEQEEVFSNGNWASPIKGYLANVRSDTKEVLGIVSDRYCVLQNRDVFAFADELIGTNKVPCAYETAGSLFNGRRVFMLINMPERKIVGDTYLPYLCVSNSHDASSPLQVCLTGVRVVCNNTLQAALRSAKRKISIRHLSCMAQRKDEAVRAMGAASKYFQGLENFAEYIAGRKVNITKVVQKLFPVKAEMTKKQVQNNSEIKQLIKSILKNKDDLQNFRGTAWGAYNAVVDFRDHAIPKRKTPTYGEHKMARFIDGDEIIQKAQDIILELAA